MDEATINKIKYVYIIIIVIIIIIYTIIIIIIIYTNVTSPGLLEIQYAAALPGGRKIKHVSITDLPG